MKTFFFGCHEGKLETFAKICVAVSLETLCEDLTVCVRDKQAAWKLLSKISRTAPECMSVVSLLYMYTMYGASKQQNKSVIRFNQYNFLYLSYTSCLVQAWLGDLSLILMSCYTTVTPFPSH